MIGPGGFFDPDGDFTALLAAIGVIDNNVDDILVNLAIVDGVVDNIHSDLAVVDGNVDAIKLKTDNLPASPAAVGSVMTLTAAYDAAKTALQTSDIAVSAKNSANNVDIVDVIGNKTDDEDGDSIMSKLYILLKHIHSAQKVYPTLAAGVTLAGGAGGWQLGNFVEVVAANTITSPFDIHFINPGSASANDTYEIVLYSGALGAEVETGRCRVTRTSNVSDISPVPCMTDLLPANTRVSAKVASGSGGGDTIIISVFYHTY